jgi:hypothetical protein
MRCGRKDYSYIKPFSSAEADMHSITFFLLSYTMYMHCDTTFAFSSGVASRCVVHTAYLHACMLASHQNKTSYATSGTAHQSPSAPRKSIESSLRATQRPLRHPPRRLVHKTHAVRCAVRQYVVSEITRRRWRWRFAFLGARGCVGRGWRGWG